MEGATPPRVARITLAIECDSAPIAGAVLDPARAAGPFRGWLELTTRIDAVHRGGGDEPGGDPLRVERVPGASASAVAPREGS